MKGKEVGNEVRERGKDSPVAYLFPKLSGSIYGFIIIRAII